MAKTITSGLPETIRRGNDYPTRAIILAAGKGKRLEPTTCETPKPLLKVDGLPMLETVLLALDAARVHKTTIVVNHLAEQIMDFVGDGSKWNMTVHYEIQRNTLGTADALKVAADQLVEPCFVLAADYSLPMSYLLDLKQYYHTDIADLVMSLKEIPKAEVKHRSTVQLDEKGEIIKIVEKPTVNVESDQLGASLIYIVPPEIKHFLDQVKLSPRGECEIQDLVQLMIDQGFMVKGLIQVAPRERKSGDNRCLRGLG